MCSYSPPILTHPPHTLYSLSSLSLTFRSGRSGLVQVRVYLHISPDSKNDPPDFGLTKDIHTETNTSICFINHGECGAVITLSNTLSAEELKMFDPALNEIPSE